MHAIKVLYQHEKTTEKRKIMYLTFIVKNELTKLLINVMNKGALTDLMI